MGKTGCSQIKEHNKARIGTMFSKHPCLFVRSAAFEIEVHHRTAWRFLRRELNVFPYKRRMYQQVNNEYGIEKIDFGQYSRDELEDRSQFLKLTFFVMTADFHC